MTEKSWPQLSFGEALTDKTAAGHKLQQSGFRSSGKFPIVDQGQSDIAGFSDEESLAWKNQLPVIVFGDHTRAIKYVDCPFVLGADGVKVLVPREGLSARFAYYYLSSIDIPSRGYSRHFRFLKEVNVPLPEPWEQERIVKLLDEADELRKLRAQADRRTADLIPALFHEMFGNPNSNSQAWPKKRLSTVVNLINGRAFKTTEWGKTGLPIIRIQNLKNPSAPFNYFDGWYDPKYFVNKGALLISWAGQLVSFGVHVWNGPIGLLNQHIFRAEKLIETETEFIQYAVSHVIEAAKSNFHGIEMKHITKGALADAEVIFPPLAYQRLFSSRVQEIRKLEISQAESRKRLDVLFQSMLHRAFQGEL